MFVAGNKHLKSVQMSLSNVLTTLRKEHVTAKLTGLWRQTLTEQSWEADASNCKGLSVRIFIQVARPKEPPKVHINF